MEHKRFAQHLLAERFNAEKGSWEKKKNKQNHWLDTLVGAVVAASMCGASILPAGQKKPAGRSSLKGWFGR
jgi:rhamnogalacturonyl hydrolase YesR